MNLLLKKRRLIALLSTAVFAGMSFVYAQEIEPESKQPLPPSPPSMPVPSLPPLRTAEPIKSQINRDMALKERSLSRPANASSPDDIAKVVPVKCKRPKGKFPWNLDKIKVTELLEQMSRLSCESFILSSSVKPTQEVSMISRVPITVDQAWQAFLSVLESNELALVKTGQYYKLVKRKDSIRQPLPLVDDKNKLPANEGMVTYLHDVRHMSKDVAITLAKGLTSMQGEVLPVGDSFLVITDGASNIRRIMNILEKVDIVGAANRVHVVELAYADALQVQQKLLEIFDTKNANDYRGRSMNLSSRNPRFGAGGNVGGDGFSVQKIIADERTNKLITIASDSAYARIKEMIDILDVPSSDASSQGQVNVYYLKNGDAKKIATTLSSVTQGNSGAGRRSPGPRMGFRDDGALFEGDIKITADESTNALVIVASPRDYKSLSAVIAKLDKERIQVYVEAAILDIGLTDKNNLGINGFGAFEIPGMKGAYGLMANPTGVGLATGLVKNIGAAGMTGIGSAAGTAIGLAGLLNTIGFMGPPIPGTSIPSIGAVLEAVQKYSNVDVLSTPSLMTLDNEKAEMSVGEKIPQVSGISAVGGSAGLGVPIQNITYQDVKLKFAITPHVNDNNAVRLEIDQDVNELGQEEAVLPGVTQWRVRTKSAKTTVMAQDQQTIVLAGLIGQSRTETEDKIPWFGDIPFFGYLAKRKTKTIEKKNLLLVLTPYVIRSEDDLRKVYARKMKEREEFGMLYFGDKITKFDPHVDYDKKTGPVHRLLEQVDEEMQKVENGGQGSPGDTVIKNEGLELQKKSLDMSIKAPEGETPPPNPDDNEIDPDDEDDDDDEEEIIDDIPGAGLDEGVPGVPTVNLSAE